MTEPEKNQITVFATVDSIVDGLTIDPDCNISSVLPGANNELRKVIKPGFRIISVNENITLDSGELKAALFQEAPNNTPVKIVLERSDTHSAKIPIEDSVLFNGSTSKVAEPSEKAVARLMKAINSALVTTKLTKTLRPRVPLAAGEGDQADVLSHLSNRNSSRSSDHGSSSGTSMFSTVSDGSDLALSGLSTISMRQEDNEDMKKGLSFDSAPRLLEFEKMKETIRSEDAKLALQHALKEVKEVSARQCFSKALSRARPGRCIICIVNDLNPIAELELLAMASQRRLVSVDVGVKLRLRPNPTAFAKLFVGAMRSGAWFLLSNAHKSINICGILDGLLKEAHACNLEGFSPDARIIISLYPHIHFPKSLIHDAIVIKLVSRFEGSAIMYDSLCTTVTKARFVTSDTMSLSFTNPSILSASTAVVQKPPKRRVVISAAVDIVDIAPREVVSPPKEEPVIDVTGSVVLFKSFSGVPNDKFLCVTSAGEASRFAVGSSLGNVYFLDALGNSLLQTHPHNASIWDLSFHSKYTFVTGCEDGSSISWNLSSKLDPTTNDPVLVPVTATSLGADVYCVSYLKNMVDPPVVIGGLHNNLVIRPSNGDSVELLTVAIPLNAQVVDCLPSSATVLVGGGDGSVSIVDAGAAKLLGSLKKHTRKVPTLTVHDNNQFFTGGFDSNILLWDLRIPGGIASTVSEGQGLSATTKYTLKLRNYVTGIDVDNIHLTACVGENLYLWDIRKLHTVLGGYPQGWVGLSRGIKIQHSSRLVVTASPDGLVRFWNYI